MMETSEAMGSPRPEMLEIVSVLAGEILECDVTPDDDFFMLGGDSMLAMHLVGRVSRATGLKVRMVHLIANPVLRDFAEQVETLQAAASTADDGAALVAVLSLADSAGDDRAL